MGPEFNPTLKVGGSIWRKEINESINTLDSTRNEMMSETFNIIRPIMARLPYSYDYIKIANRFNESIHTGLKHHLQDLKKQFKRELYEMMSSGVDPTLITMRIAQLTSPNGINRWKEYIRDHTTHLAETRYDELLNPPVHTVNLIPNNTWR